jgi:hypothetical protein
LYIARGCELPTGLWQELIEKNDASQDVGAGVLVVNLAEMLQALNGNYFVATHLLSRA